MMKFPSTTIKLLVIVFFLLSPLVFPEIYYVKKDGDDASTGTTWQTAFQTITKAMDISELGDNIWVKEGTYQEGDTITISEGVTLYGGFAGTETSLTQRIISEHPTIIDGGTYSTYNTCVNNSYGSIDGFCITNGYCGGIFNYYGTVTNCTLYSNINFLPYAPNNGGGIENIGGTITNCILYSNTAGKHGGGIYNSHGTVNNCILYSNMADYGGGIYNEYGTVINCTVYSNSSYGCSGIDNSNGAVINCIAWNNQNMDISGDPNKIYFSCYGGARNENGNIRCNPLFINTSGDPSTWDLHLQNGSPCIDAGTTDTVYLPDQDIEGDPRPGGDDKVCMGAYESPDEYTPSIPQPPTRIYVSQSGNNTNGSSWEDAYTSITKALSSLEGDLYEIWVAEATYKENLKIPGHVNLYGGFIGTETSLEQRNISFHPAIIDGEHQGRCITNYGILDGFHIINGQGYYGGGIYNLQGIVNNCILYSNSANYGGGIYNFLGIVNKCKLYSNSSYKDGGGIYNYIGTVENCIIYLNSSGTFCGGIYNYTGTIMNCTLYSNSAVEDCGGIYNYHGSISNCIAWRNMPVDITANTNDIYFSCYNGAVEQNGNIRCNPLFMNTSGDSSTWDFHLLDGSPCIDAGTLENAPEKDIEGNPRPGLDGLVCMGAYESPDYYNPLPPIPPSRIYVSQTGNNTDGDSWINAYTSIIKGISSISGDNLYDIWVEEGTYKEGDEIYVPIYVNMYGGFTGTETFLEQRNISEHPAIIDGENTNRCFYSYGTIDGFHVINGYAAEAGGIVNFYGTVTNCTLYSNEAEKNGGGIGNVLGTVSNCTLYSNSANIKGGGIYNNSGTLTNCHLHSNSARYGAGIYNDNGTISKCTLYSNSAISMGGGIYNNGFVYNSILNFNIAQYQGGGIYNNDDNMIYNCIICSNTSWGIYNEYDGSIYNCTLYNNQGGIFSYKYGNIENCISWQNDETDIEGGAVSYSCFKEADGTNGNINADPMFIKVDGSPSTWIYQVKNGSPCIDAGNPDESYNDGCQPPGKGTVRNDMGAYGGPYNCNWGINITEYDLIGFLTGRKILYNLQFPFADFNADDKVDIADLIVLSQDLSSVSPKYP